MKKAALIFGLVFSITAIGTAQVRTVDNFTLQKFQQQRLAAERDYRDNYARLGFPSPEELDRQRDADMAARVQLSDQLRKARLEKERLELERWNLGVQAAGQLHNSVIEVEPAASYGGYFDSYGGYYSGRRYSRHSGYFPNRVYRNDGGYRATPVGVYPNPSPRRPPHVTWRGNRGGTRIRNGRH